MDDNDSFEDEPVTEREMIEHGKKIGATHVVFCYDGDELSAVYVRDGEDVDFVVEQCQGGCAGVSYLVLRDPAYEALS